MRHTLADVERGTWQPPRREPVPDDVDRDPAFHVFASEWYGQREAGWRVKTRKDYEWKLSKHLLKTFGRYRLSQIGPAEVDRFRDTKLRQGVLSAGQVNKTIGLLAQILEVAFEYEYIERNPAKGRSRRAKVTKRAPVWLDSAEHIAALLDAAGELDREARADRQVPRRAILATLTFTGLRIGELRELRWRNVDLAAGWLTVTAQSKTDAGQRRIRLLPILRDELATLKATAKASADERVFPTQRGNALNDGNVRKRILAKAVERANKRLEKRGSAPLPEGLTPHKLRHTFASLLIALGTDPGVVMDELGHADAGFTLRTYRHGMRRDEKSKGELRALVDGGIVAGSGSNEPDEGQTVPSESNGHQADMAL